MTTFTIDLPDEQAGKLRELAREAGVTPEELLRTGVEHWLARPASGFAEAAAYVLKKNAALYGRLS